MGEMILVLGENDSGKSRFAERIAVHEGEERIYLATMICATKENEERIQKHIRQRENAHFMTIESPYSVSDSPVSENSVVLLEDVSNLLANVMFGSGNLTENNFCEECFAEIDFQKDDFAGNDLQKNGIEQTAITYVYRKVFDDILRLKGKCKTLIAVSISGLEPEDTYDDETNHYINSLNTLNEMLLEQSEVGIAMDCQKPHFLKGALPYDC